MYIDGIVSSHGVLLFLVVDRHAWFSSKVWYISFPKWIIAYISFVQVFDANSIMVFMHALDIYAIIYFRKDIYVKTPKIFCATPSQKSWIRSYRHSCRLVLQPTYNTKLKGHSWNNRFVLYVSLPLNHHQQFSITSFGHFLLTQCLLKLLLLSWS